MVLVEGRGQSAHRDHFSVTRGMVEEV